MTSVVKSSRPSKQAKLRNSCDACSMAKVKCTKEKPVCTRCVKRGQLCMYGTSKRAGRPSQSKISHPGSVPATYMIPKTSFSDSPDASTRRISSTPMDTSLFPSVTPDLTSATQIWSDICATLISSPRKSSDVFSSTSATDMDYYSSMGSVASACDTPESYLEDMPIPTTEMDLAPDYGACGLDLAFTDASMPLDCSGAADFGEVMGQFPHPLVSPDPAPLYMQPLSGDLGFDMNGYMPDALNMVGPMETIPTS